MKILKGGFIKSLQALLGLGQRKYRLRAVEFDEEHNARGIYKLMLSGPVRCLPGNRYIATERQIHLLDENGIPYRSLKLDEVLSKQEGR